MLDTPSGTKKVDAVDDQSSQELFAYPQNATKPYFSCTETGAPDPPPAVLLPLLLKLPLLRRRACVSLPSPAQHLSKLQLLGLQHLLEATHLVDRFIILSIVLNNVGACVGDSFQGVLSIAEQYRFLRGRKCSK